MHRGELWTIAGGPGEAGKPRPGLIVQDDLFSETASTVICPLTSREIEMPFFRVAVRPDENNGLRAPSHVMVDKITTLSRSHLGRRIGALAADDMARVEQAMLLFLGLTRTRG